MQDITLHDNILTRIGKLADAGGFEIYLVGGYVRDLVMDRENKDIDISVVGDGIAFAHQAAKKLGAHGFVEFKKFGTARLQHKDTAIEFVGTRKEVYSGDSRKPEIESGNIHDDLLRRDFTVNAIGVSLNKGSFGRVIDPFAGMKDIGNRLLRTPMDPAKTFSDDPLRMMRAFRFAAQLGFTVDPAALEAISGMHSRIAIVSIERIRDEFLKLLATRKPSIGLAPMQETGVMAHFFKEFHDLAGVDQKAIDDVDGVRNYHHKDVFYHTLQVLDNLAEVSDDVWLRMAAVLHDIAKPRTKSFKPEVGWTFHGHAEIGARMVSPIFHKLRLPLDPVPFVSKMVALHLRPIALVDDKVTDSAIRRLLFDAGDDIDKLLQLCRADITSKNPKLVRRYLRNYDLLIRKMEEIEEKDTLRSWQPPLRGEEIMEACGIGPGIAVGVLKTRIEDAILDGVISNSKDAAYRYLEAIKDDVLSQSVLKKSKALRQKLRSLPSNLKS